MRELLVNIDCNDEKFYQSMIKEIMPHAKLQEYIEELGFFTAPASTQYHGSQKYGLIKHSLATYYALSEVLNVIECENSSDQEWKNDAKAASILHDLCKADLYISQQKWRKDANNKWESYDAFVVDKSIIQIGHGTESLRRIEKHYTFTFEAWAQAVAWHMPPPEGWVERQQYYSAIEKYPEILALQWADQYATYILKK